MSKTVFTSNVTCTFCNDCLLGENYLIYSFHNKRKQIKHYTLALQVFILFFVPDILNCFIYLILSLLLLLLYDLYLTVGNYSLNIIFRFRILRSTCRPKCFVVVHHFMYYMQTTTIIAICFVFEIEEEAYFMKIR